MYPYPYSAIIPYYDTQGANVTYTISRNGVIKTHPVPVKHFLNNIFNELSLDPKWIKTWTSHILCYKANHPILFNEDLVFIPVKMRTPIGKRDGCYGYVLLDAITDFNKHTITLHNKQIINTLSPSTYIRDKLINAKFLSYTYQDQKGKYDFMRIHLFPVK